MDALDSIFRQYNGKNYDKAMRLTKDMREEMKRDFLNKYRNVDIDKFRFEVSINQDLNVKKNIYKRSMTQCLTASPPTLLTITKSGQNT